MAEIGLALMKYGRYAEAGGAAVYTGVRSLGKPISADLQIETTEAPLYAGDELDENPKRIVGASLNVGVKELDYVSQSDLYGHTRTPASGGAPESLRKNFGDQSNAVGVGIASPVIREGVEKYRAVFFDKAIFSSPGFAYKTKEKTITYSTPTTMGTIMGDPAKNFQDDAVLDTLVEAEAWIDEHFGLLATLESLTFGSISLTPTFDADVVEYTTETTNATNTITAVAEDEDATIVIKVNGNSITNGSAATWDEGENTVEVTVTNGTTVRTYTVTVTKTT